MTDCFKLFRVVGALLLLIMLTACGTETSPDQATDKKDATALDLASPDALDPVDLKDLALSFDLSDTSTAEDLADNSGPKDFGPADVSFPLGSFENPILIASLPYTDQRNTLDAPLKKIDYYIPCAPEINESGGEFVYRLEITQSGTLTISVDDVSGDSIDIDVHLLSEADSDKCIARDNVRVTRQVTPGTYWIVADTWVNASGLVLAGQYKLSVSFDSGVVTPPVDVQNPPDLGQPDLAPPEDMGPPPDLGRWDNPIEVDTFPFTHSANTLNPAAALVNSYSPCAPGTNEGGGEFVYKVTLVDSGVLTVGVADPPGDGVDPDVHLLSAPAGDSCLARDNRSVSKKLPAGTYWVVVDTWVNASGVPQSGPYTLTISFSKEDVTDCLSSPIACTENDKPLVNGVPTEPPGVDGCPAGMVPVGDTFCIDRYEAMLVLDDGGALKPFSPFQNPGTAVVRALSVPGVVPQGYITQVEAKNACIKANKRLCSDSEWLKACRGSQNQTYPYGSTRQPKLCNDSRTCHPVVQYFESTAQWIWSKLAHPCINQLPDGLARTGEYSSCKSPYEVFDMMGNLHEWTSNSSGVFRGGYYMDTKKNGNGCLYATTAHNVYHWDYSTGFRCCWSRPPN